MCSLKERVQFALEGMTWSGSHDPDKWYFYFPLTPRPDFDSHDRTRYLFEDSKQFLDHCDEHQVVENNSADDDGPGNHNYVYAPARYHFDQHEYYDYSSSDDGHDDDESWACSDHEIGDDPWGGECSDCVKVKHEWTCLEWIFAIACLMVEDGYGEGDIGPGKVCDRILQNQDGFLELEDELDTDHIYGNAQVENNVDLHFDNLHI